MINNVVLMGRMTVDPELKKTQTGVSVTSFRIAVERNFADKDGKRQADFIDCVAWKNTAEFICRYFPKGAMIAVTGSIQTRNYDDKNGNKRTATEVIVDQASFCGSKAESRPDVNISADNAPTDNDFEEIVTADDLPF